MEAKANIPPLEARRNEAAGILYEKLVRLDQNFWNREPCERLKTHITFITEARKINDHLIGNKTIEHRQDLLPPNINVALLEIPHSLTIQDIKGKKNNHSVDQLKKASLAYIRQRYPENEWLHLYTDGSASPGEGNAGARIYCREFEASYPAGANGSNYDGEVRAIFEALLKLKQFENKKIVILSDSKTAIEAIVSREEAEPEIRQCKLQFLRLMNAGNIIMLQWIPAHCGIYGNEKADYLAKQGSKKPQENKKLSHKALKSHLHASTYKAVRKGWREKGQNKQWQHYTVDRPAGQRKCYSRRIETAQFRLQTGHDLLGKHLHRFGIFESGICRMCGVGEQDRNHLFKCTYLNDERNKMPSGMDSKEQESYLYWITRKHMMV